MISLIKRILLITPLIGFLLIFLSMIAVRFLTRAFYPECLKRCEQFSDLNLNRFACDDFCHSKIFFDLINWCQTTSLIEILAPQIFYISIILFAGAVWWFCLDVWNGERRSRVILDFLLLPFALAQMLLFAAFAEILPLFEHDVLFSQSARCHLYFCAQLEQPANRIRIHNPTPTLNENLETRPQGYNSLQGTILPPTEVTMQMSGIDLSSSRNQVAANQITAILNKDCWVFGKVKGWTSEEEAIVELYTRKVTTTDEKMASGEKKRRIVIGDSIRKLVQ